MDEVRLEEEEIERLQVGLERPNPDTWKSEIPEGPDGDLWWKLEAMKPRPVERCKRCKGTGKVQVVPGPGQRRSAHKGPCSSCDGIGIA